MATRLTEVDGSGIHYVGSFFLLNRKGFHEKRKQAWKDDDIPGTSTLMLNRFRLADVFYVQDLGNLYMLIINCSSLQIAFLCISKFIVELSTRSNAISYYI
jgi:hypothetical protein